MRLGEVSGSWSLGGLARGLGAAVDGADGARVVGAGGDEDAQLLGGPPTNKTEAGWPGQFCRLGTNLG